MLNGIAGKSELLLERPGLAPELNIDLIAEENTPPRIQSIVPQTKSEELNDLEFSLLKGFARANGMVTTDFMLAAALEQGYAACETFSAINSLGKKLRNIYTRLKHSASVESEGETYERAGYTLSRYAVQQEGNLLLLRHPSGNYVINTQNKKWDLVTGTEYSYLRAFLNRPDVSQKWLETEIHGQNYTNRTVRSHITRIRKKLDFIGFKYLIPKTHSLDDNLTTYRMNREVLTQ